MKVWILQITHKYGSNSSVHSSSRGAHDALVAYIDDWWEQECKGSHPPPDHEDRIREYFNATAGVEDYEITECEVQ